MLGLLEHDVLSSIEVPFLPDNIYPSSDLALLNIHTPPDQFSLKYRDNAINRQLSSSSSTVTVGATVHRSSLEKNASNRLSATFSKFPPIEESPRPIIVDLPPEHPPRGSPSPARLVGGLTASPLHSSTLSVQSASPTSSTSSRKLKDLLEKIPASTSTSKLTPHWLFKPFRSVPAAPQATPVSASATPRHTSATVIHEAPPQPVVKPTSIPRPPQPMAIKNSVSGRSVRDEAFDEDPMISHRRSPVNMPSSEATIHKRRSSTMTSLASHPTFSPPQSRQNPSRPKSAVSLSQSTLARRWQHMFPLPITRHEVKWKSMVTPGCLPLTTEYMPTISELESSYDVSSWHFVIDPREMRSFLVKPPATTGDADQVRRAWARAVMRGMAAVRLAQGFQIALRPSRHTDSTGSRVLRRGKSFLIDDDMTPTPAGAAEALDSSDSIFLSMSNEIHKISCNGETIQVRRYVRRMPLTRPFEYQCLIWPKLGVGYTELKTSFLPHSLENYGWNR